jgi:hypothetical protein
MHPISPTLSAMVVAATLTARHAARVPADPGELERYAQRVLGGPPRGRLKITGYLPVLILKPVLARLALLPRFG